MTPAVFDLNVVISAAGWGGTPAKCMSMVENGRVRGAVSEPMLTRLRERLTDRLQLDPTLAEDVIARIRRSHRVVELTMPAAEVTVDPEDDIVLATALAAEATHLVTGDRRHLLPLIEYHTVRIVTPVAFLREVDAA